MKQSDRQRRWSIHKCKQYGSQEAVFNSILTSSLIISSDGSFLLPYATAAIILYADKTNYIEISLHTPGHPEILHSHRAEVSGHYAILLSLEVIEQTMVFLILRQPEKLKLNATTSPHCDYMMTSTFSNHTRLTMTSCIRCRNESEDFLLPSNLHGLKVTNRLM